MPEHLKALAIILVLATGIFAFARPAACSKAITTEDFDRRRNLWFAITLTVFLSHNFWIFIGVVAILMAIFVRREPNKLALYFFLLFAAPAIPDQVTGLGLMNYFFEIDYVRLLALTILLPAYLALRREADNESFGHTLPDKLLAAYIVLNIILMLSVSTVTNTLRYGVFYSFIDIFLPYYVASRSLKRMDDFRDALMSFAVAALVLCPIVAFEFARHWLLYSSLNDVLGAPRWGYGIYLYRAGESLRALGSVGHALVLGYVMAVAIGIFLFLRRSVEKSSLWQLGMGLLVVGLIAPVSRGPWVGAALVVLVFVATGPSAAKRLMKLAFSCAIALPVLLASPWGEKLVDYLPFVGTVESENVVYRQRLLQNSIEVILKNPYFGGFDFMYSQEMQEMKQGQGIIDIVNTYLAVSLGSGLVGLALFAGVFVAVGSGIVNSMRTLPDRASETYLLGRSLLCTLVGILTIIATTSSILVIPVIYWAVAGLGVGYIRLSTLARTDTTPVRSVGLQSMAVGGRS